MTPGLRMLGAISVVLTGCVHEVRPEPRVQAPMRALLPLRVKYYLPPGESARVAADHFLLLGIVHRWDIEIGAALAQSFPRMLQTVFASVTAATGPDDLADADLFVSPVITHFDVDGGSFVSTLKVRLLVLGADRHAILEEELVASPPEGDESRQALWTGVFGGGAALQSSAEHSFELLLSRMAGRLFDALAHERSGNALGV